MKRKFLYFITLICVLSAFCLTGCKDDDGIDVKTNVQTKVGNTSDIDVNVNTDNIKVKID